MPEIITRAEAKARGLTRYFTAKPCPHGHVCERAVSTRHCMGCDRNRKRAAARKRRAANPEAVRQSERERRAVNIEARRQSGRWGYAANLELRREQARKRATKIPIFIEIARDMGLIRKGDTRKEQRVIVSELKRLGIFKNEDLET
jgi:hypothetical protein